MFKKGRAKKSIKPTDVDNNARTQINTVIGRSTTIEGNIHFTGVMKIDGMVNGSMTAEGESSILIVNEGGRIQGEVHVPSIMVNGTIEGDVHATNKVELFEKARILGDVHYSLLEMEVGSAVNGKLVNQSTIEPHITDAPDTNLKAPDI